MNNMNNKKLIDFCRKSSRNFLKILKIFKIVENRQNSSKIVNFQRLQRNSSKNVMSDASSRITSFGVFWRQSTSAFDARRRSTAKIDELRHLTSNDVIFTRRSHHFFILKLVYLTRTYLRFLLKVVLAYTRQKSRKV